MRGFMKHNLMTRERMLGLYESGVDPWWIVVDKWERIREFVSENDTTDDPYMKRIVEYHILSDTCILCELHKPVHDILCKGERKLGILPCPLNDISRCSYEDDSIWNTFNDDMTRENAQRVIDALVQASMMTIDEIHNLRDEEDTI